MPWKECNHMDERLRLVAKLLDGEKMAEVCREFGISRKTGYKIFNRYKDIGIEGLQDRTRTPVARPRILSPIQPLVLSGTIGRYRPLSKGLEADRPRHSCSCFR
jgi:transposase-like protein